MKILQLTILIICLLFACASNAQTITLQHGNTATFETRLDTAIKHAVSGDIIYLPGGTISTGAVTINKKLKIIGCGYNPDSSAATGITTITQGISFSSGGDSSSISGIYCNSSIGSTISNISVSRCNFLSLGLNSNNLSNISVSESIIRNTSALISTGTNTYTNLVINKNIIYGYVQGCSGAFYSNNLFLAPGGASQILQQVSNCTFQNNIFTASSGLYGSSGVVSGNSFQYNLFVMDSATVNNATYQSSTSRNFYSEPLANIFISGSTSAWTTAQNYHLKAGCRGIGSGSDATDIGLYGTSTPFKDGGLPINPHYQFISIPGNSTSDGKLNINISVESQNR